MQTKRLLPIICLLFVFSIKLAAQGQANYWYFGHNAGLNFNPGAPVAITDGALTTLEGCATISDSLGNLLFYTDGLTVWNKLHAAMPNGTGLYGDLSTTQSGIIVPKPGTSTTFYIFTAAAAGGPAGLCYSEVDLTLHGGLGDVTALKNVFLYADASEKLTAVKNFDGINYWTIAHNNSGNKYLAYAVTSSGVTTTPVISITGGMDATYSGAGYMKASSGGGKLVSAFSGSDFIDVLDFDNTTGIVSFDFSISAVNPYGVEFSRNEKRLYTASWGSSTIKQYDMSLGSSTAIIASATIIGTSSAEKLGSLQNAPDGKMYVSKYGASSLGCITNPNALGVGCGYTDAGVNIPARMCTYGLPNFMPKDFKGSTFDYVNICMGDSTFFSLTDSITVDSIYWNFGDPASGAANNASSYSVSHIFNSIGNYTVSVITYLDAAVDTSTSVVNIFGPPDMFIGNDTAICAGKFMTIDAGTGSGYSYLWQDGSTTQTFSARAGGTYYVSVSPCLWWL